MICGLIGEIIKLEPMRAEVNVNGVIYEVFLSVQTSSKLELNKTSKLLTTHIIREDANLLFGFLDSLEQKSFERLLKINGVGVKVAIAILSTYKSEEFAMLVNNKDLKAIQKVPGIGAKMAGKILLDLAGFFDEIVESNKESNNKLDSNMLKASLALESLGYKQSDIKKVLASLDSSLETQELIKLALKSLR